MISAVRDVLVQLRSDLLSIVHCGLSHDVQLNMYLWLAGLCCITLLGVFICALGSPGGFGGLCLHRMYV